MKKLAGRFGLSDVGLAKACKQANIPRPPRGYWAKLAAGKQVLRTPLPARGPGMYGEVRVGGGRYGYYRQLSEEDVLRSEPSPPMFEDDIKDVAKQVKSIIPRVTVPRFPDRAHRQIRQLLEADEERRQKQLASRFPLSWDAPIFDDVFENRRLRILNAIMSALEKAGMKPSLHGREARDLNVRINDTTVRFTLDAKSQKHDPYGRSAIQTSGAPNKLRFAIFAAGASSDVSEIWEETDTEKLEISLTDIVVQLIVSGERQYREHQQRRYDWLIRYKSDLIEERRKQKEEAERHERERLAVLEKARIDSLLQSATAFRQAEDIRRFVAGVEECYAAGDVPVLEADLATWRRWALDQADLIDPVRSGRVIDTMRTADAPDSESQV